MPEDLFSIADVALAFGPAVPALRDCDNDFLPQVAEP